MKCAACGKHGAVLDVMPYSVAYGVTAWLHSRCSHVTRDEGWRREFARKAEAKGENMPGMRGAVPAGAGVTSEGMQRAVRGEVEPAPARGDSAAVSEGAEAGGSATADDAQ